MPYVRECDPLRNYAVERATTSTPCDILQRGVEVKYRPSLKAFTS
jgi:hypothetical protein